MKLQINCWLGNHQETIPDETQDIYCRSCSNYVRTAFDTKLNSKLRIQSRDGKMWWQE